MKMIFTVCSYHTMCYVTEFQEQRKDKDLLESPSFHFH